MSADREETAPIVSATIEPVKAAGTQPTAATPSVPDYSATGWTGGHNPWAIAFVVTLATFMEILDTSIANVALPQISGNLGVGRNEGTWVLTSYLIANAVMVPISGWLANRIGRKRFYITCVVLFTATSLLCGIAPTLGALVFCRVLQGISGGGLVPTEQAILMDTFSPAKRGTALAVYGMTVILAPALGPTLGGYLTHHLSWRWIFIINVPIGLLSAVLTNRFVSDPPHLVAARERGGRIDWAGFALIVVGLGFLELMLEKGQEHDWFYSRLITVSAIISAVALTMFVIRSWHHENPIVDVRLFRHRNFIIANLLMVALGFTSYGITVIMPQYLQGLMKYTASDAGLVLSPGGLTIFVLLPFMARLAPKVDARILVTIGFVAVGSSAFYCAQTLNLQIDFGGAVRLRILQCVGFAFLFVPIQGVAYGGLPMQKYNQVASIMNLSRNIGADLGIAFLVTTVYRHRQIYQVQLNAHTGHYDAPFNARLAELARLFEMAGVPSVEAARRALAATYLELQTQAQQLAYFDAIRGIALVAFAGAVVTWGVRRFKAPTAATASH